MQLGYNRASPEEKGKLLLENISVQYEKFV